MDGSGRRTSAIDWICGPGFGRSRRHKIHSRLSGGQTCCLRNNVAALLSAALNFSTSFRKLLGDDFFRSDPLVCAPGLVGTTLVWGRCAGIIVETEAYMA